MKDFICGAVDLLIVGFCLVLLGALLFPPTVDWSALDDMPGNPEEEDL